MSIKTKVECAMRFDSDVDGTDGKACSGLSVMSYYLITSTSNGARKKVHFDFIKMENGIKWTIQRHVYNIFNNRQAHMEETYTTFPEFISALTRDENAARKHFIKYLIDELEEELRWNDSCQAIHDEVKRYQDAEEAKEVLHA